MPVLPAAKDESSVAVTVIGESVPLMKVGMTVAVMMLPMALALDAATEHTGI